MRPAPPASSPTPWPTHSVEGVFAPGAVQVWRLDLPDGLADADRFAATLAADERKRVARFRSSADQARFAVVRGWLRTLLGAYLDVRPETPRFSYGPHGKPALADPNRLDLRFNLSHSGDVALVAVARGQEVGVDVERVRLGRLRLAARFFAPDEVLQLRGLPPEEQDLAFHRCWTRKEAFVKARGEGLNLPLDRFAVSVAPGDRPSLRWVADDPREASRWSVHDLPEIPGYATALVVAAPLTTLSCWRWTG